MCILVIEAACMPVPRLQKWCAYLMVYCTAKTIGSLSRAASTHLWGGSVSLLAQLTFDDNYLIEVRSQMMQLRQLWLRQGVMALSDSPAQAACCATGR